ncbi:MAG: DUF2310 family Zn-ribbon-containing protein [Desulfobacteraceae bacterium]|jgi:hypothetical protein
MIMKDPYQKLIPEMPTPDDEVCHCEELKDIYLAHKLGSNPVHCLRCNGEIPPEKLALSGTLADSIASWNSVYGSLYALWLDSGEYENWARDRLLDVKGQVNIDGLDLVKQLDRVAISYYLWFYENDDDVPNACPLCGIALEKSYGIDFLKCRSCKIII